ncbi:MAG: DUF4185 domain-containing protein [Clostridiales bacterium]|nr:DUF4185 domain-containing protein [Clostridiales bacterium]
MKKHGKLLLLMALICACLMMCACESCKVTGDFRLNGDGSGERHISIHIPRVTAEGGESASYYYLKKHGDELAAWAEDCYALHVPETTGWLKASTQENAEEEILTLSFSFSSFEEYLTRMDLLISSEYPYTLPTMEAVDGKVVRYTEGADVLPAVFHTLENWFYSDETMFDLKATKPDGTQLNTQYSQADIAGSSLSPIDRTMQAVMTVTIDGGDPIGLRTAYGAFRYEAPGYEDPELALLTVTEAPEWSALFERFNNPRNTWLAADGIFGIALNGDDSHGSATADTNTFFIFSDTLVGPSDENGHRLPYAPYYMPNHSAAVLKGNVPLKENLSFYWGKDGSCPTSERLLNNEKEKNLAEHRKWFGDGVVIGDTLYLFCYTPVDLHAETMDLVTIPIVDNMPDFTACTIVQDIPQLKYTRADTGEFVLYGYVVTAMTETAKVPNPDGYVYLYGKWSGNKEVSVARVLETDFPDFTKLTFWDGEGWSANIADAVQIATLDGVSEEFSISPVTVGPHKGKFIAVYMEDSTSSHIMYAFSDTPWGPFTEPQLAYSAPEATDPWFTERGCWTYQAKAYPHLSHDDKLLVSYNINTFDNPYQDNITYRPRFVWLDLDPTNDSEVSAE